MPHHAAGSSHSAKARRARQLLSGAGVTREDSDDELGLEDHPWQWIYSTNNGDESYNVKMNEPVRGLRSAEEPWPWRPKDNSLQANHNGESGQRRIIGARMGIFKCMIGDCVLLKAEGTNEAWVGLICEFQEENEEGDPKAANFMWFSTENEIRNKQKKRSDALQVRCTCGLTTSHLPMCFARTETLLGRTSSTLHHRGIQTLWHRSTAKLRSSQQKSSTPNTLLVRFLGRHWTMARFLSAAEAATHAQRPTPRNLLGKMYFTAPTQI